MSASKCPFCGQQLTNRTAIEHLRRSQSAFEAKLRADASAAAKETLEKAKKAALADANARVAEMRERLERDEARTEQKIRGELERARANRDIPGDEYADPQANDTAPLLTLRGFNYGQGLDPPPAGCGITPDRKTWATQVRFA